MEKYAPPPGALALVTGASSGIGLALARELAARGCHLVLTSRRLPVLRQVAAGLARAHGIRVHCLAADLARPGGAEALLAQLAKRRFVIDILVNNAGFGLVAGPQVDQPADEVRALIELNAAAPVVLASALGRAMRERGRGWILNVASTASFQPMPYAALYGASKAFLLSFSEALWTELRGSGVTVSAVCPGITDTAFFRGKRPRIPAWLYRMLTPQFVARRALAALFAGRPSRVPSRQHWLLAQLPRLLPRRWILKLMEKIEKKRKGLR